EIISPLPPYGARQPFYLITCSRGREPLCVVAGSGSGAGWVASGGIALPEEKNTPWPFSRAKTPVTATVGIEHSRDIPLKRAANCTKSSPSVKRWVAPPLILSTISPSFTYSAGTRVWASTFTDRYGVNPLSPHHSQMARIKYGLLERSLAIWLYFRITFSDAVNESMKAGRLNNRSAYFING